MIFMDETKKVDFITDKWISLRTSGFVNLLVRRTSRFFDEIRALLYKIRNNLLCIKENGYLERADSRTCDASRNYKLKSAKTELF